MAKSIIVPFGIEYESRVRSCERILAFAGTVECKRIDSLNTHFKYFIFSMCSAVTSLSAPTTVLISLYNLL